MIKHSINMHRGCFGGCSFCTISAHQGKFVASRSKASILREVESIKQMPDFRGTITDLGGPSANMYKMKGKEQWICDECVRVRAASGRMCAATSTPTTPRCSISTRRARDRGRETRVRHERAALRSVPARATRTARGEGEPRKYVDELVEHHVSGRLKVAPEHTSDAVLRVMRKPSFNLFYKFKEKFDRAAKKAGKAKTQIIPYFISSHPGSRPEDMAKLALKTKDLGFKLEQVQDFTPTPMTVATEIYATGVHPYNAGVRLRGAHARGETGAAQLFLLVQTRDEGGAEEDHATAGSDRHGGAPA
jgi:uncharacterized radical SAM protein YgiQ